MNRAARRAAPKPKQMGRAEWAAGICAVHKAAGGAIDIYHVAPTDMLLLISLSLCGDNEASALVQAVAETIGHVEGAPPGLPALCGNCDARIKGTPFLVTISAPMGKPLSGSTAICSTLCVHCQADVSGNALKAIRRIWPEARCISVTHPEGGSA